MNQNLTQFLRQSSIPFMILVLPFSLAQATDLCAAFRNTAPLPDWYKSVCNPEGGGIARVGGAFSTFADSFNLNPASIPTTPTPYGVEYVGSITSGTSTAMRHNFAFIKGYQRIGAGISTNSDDTFYSNSPLQNYSGITYGDSLQAFVPSSIAPTLNLGTAISLLPERLASTVSSNLGATLKFNKMNQKLGPGAGITLGTPSFTVGASVVRETETEYSSATTYYTLTAGYKTPRFQFEYVRLTNQSGNLLVSEPMHVFTVSGAFSGLIATGAIRRLTNYENSKEFQIHLAIQYQFSRYFAVGYLLNYIPGTQSLGMQVFL